MTARHLAFAFSFVALPALAAPPVTTELGEDSLVVKIDGEHFATFNTSLEKGRPYWHPIRATNGVVVSETRPSDHVHHTGIYIGVEHVNGLDYWGSKEVMRAEKVPAADVPGKVANRELTVTKAEGDHVSLRIVNAWIGKDTKPAVTETTVVHVHRNGLMAFDITLTAAAETVSFEDTKEGFFAIRLPEGMTEKKGKGTIVNPAGEKGESASWGKPNPWLDYFAPVDGKTAGVALFDHPDNFRPSRYHVRGYGLFAVSPFGEKTYSRGKEEAKPVHLKKGETIRLRYAAYVHAGDTKSADVAGVYAKWAKGE